MLGDITMSARQDIRNIIFCGSKLLFYLLCLVVFVYSSRTYSRQERILGKDEALPTLKIGDFGNYLVPYRGKV